MLTEEERERFARDPANWRLGGIYDNPDDPRLVVPKRFWKGGGWTLNAAHGWRAGLLMAAFVAVVTVPFLVVLALGFRGPCVSGAVLGGSILLLVLWARRLSLG